MKWQITHGLELRPYFKISRQNHPSYIPKMEVNSKMREKTRTPYRSHNLKIIPGDSFVIANTPVVVRILLALNL